ncbi:MAG: hypothetical protein GY731_03960 [Gammaproteobacteria bacterium]|nr:hypothetical protein [Gammaproteobacteria bacterium]
MTINWVLEHLAKRLSTARKRYARFVSDGIGEGRREEFHQGATDERILGDDRFMEHVSGRLEKEPVSPQNMKKIIKAVCRSYEVSEKELTAPGRRRDLAEARALIGHLVITVGEESLTEVARRFGRDVATLSTGVRRLTVRARDGRISQQAEAVFETFGIDA